MSKPTTTNTTPKQPLTIRVRTFIPWMLVSALVTSSIGVIAGWTLHVDMAAQARQSVVVVESKDLK